MRGNIFGFSGRASVVAALVLSVTSARADIVSTFDADAEGWTTANGGSTVVWDFDGGNPGGGVVGREALSNRLWYFSAPAAYQGDLSQFIGGTVSWDLRGLTTNLSAASASCDVIIEGPAGRIGFPIDGNIDLSTWQTFTVPLTAVGWFSVNAFPASVPLNSAVTPAQFAAVLANVTGFYIQGEYRNGSDSSVLDNVRLEAPAFCDYDYNQDENVDLLDAQQMAQVFVGLLTPGANWLDGDLNGDENADLADAQALALFVVSGNCEL